MFAGHIGAALALGRAERRLNVGILVTAAVLLDLVLWVLVIVGWESVTIPADFSSTHQARFVFPYSHGLVASLVWSVFAGTGAWAACSRLGPARARAAMIVAAAVFSHWLLDALVHRPELPIVGAASRVVGVGLWEHMVVALLMEAAIVLGGMLMFFPGSGLTRGKSLALAALSLATLGFTVLGMAFAPPPPSALAMAGSSLVTLMLVCALFAWLGRLPRARWA